MHAFRRDAHARPHCIVIHAYLFIFLSAEHLGGLGYMLQVTAFYGPTVHTVFVHVNCNARPEHIMVTVPRPSGEKEREAALHTVRQ